MKNERKKTIGYFLTELRKRADLHDQFDQKLRDFLDHRNTFIHNLHDVPGWNLETQGGKDVARQFISGAQLPPQTVLLPSLDL